MEDEEESSGWFDSVADGIGDVYDSVAEVAEETYDDLGAAVGDVYDVASDTVHYAADEVGAAYDTVADGMSETYDAVADGVSGVYESAGEYATQAGDTVADAYESLTGSSTESQAHGSAEGGSWWDRAVDWAEDEVSSAAHGLADLADGIPVLEQVTDVAADAVDAYAEFEGGLLKGAGTLVGGIAHMVEHPVDTVIGLESMAEHIPFMGAPLKAMHEVYDVAVNDKDIGDAVSDFLDPTDNLNYWQKVGSAVIKPYEEEIEQGKYMEALGRGVFDIGSIILTGGESAAVEGAADVGRVAEVARATEGAEIAANAARGMEGAEIAANAARGMEGAEIAGDATRATEWTKAGDTLGEVRGASKDPLAGLSESEIDAALSADPRSNVMVQAPAENLASKTKPYGDGQYTDFTFDAKTSVPNAEGNVRTTMKVHDADPTAPLGSNSRNGPTVGIEQGKGNRRVVPDPESDWGGEWINKGTATSDEWNKSHIPLDGG